MKTRFATLVTLTLFVPIPFVPNPFISSVCGQVTGKMIHVKVGDVKRDAIVFAPASAGQTPSPLLFAFHGHGGTAEGSAKKFNYQKHWPQAIVVYMQGLPIVSNTDPKGKKSGWQHEAGDVDDRDLKFFDQTLARIKKDYKVDDTRIFAAEHSNGGGFTLLLWATRGDVFAALAPSSASSANKFTKDLKPKPVLHVAGEKDMVAPFDKQKTLMDAIRKINGCEEKGKKWEKLATIYPSPTGTPFVELIHTGGHEFYEEAPRLIVHFFKEHSKKK